MALTRTTLFRLYDLVWGPALFFLRRNQRLRHGWGQRVQREPYPGPCDLWIQAASVGEAFLAGEILRRLHLPSDQPEGEPLSVLLTTNTAEGMERLDALMAELRPLRPELNLRAAYFPLDRPRLMRKALMRVQPRAAVLLESEMWPGFMASCRDQNVRLLLVNGRMSERSLRGYLKFPSFFRRIAPDKILAMSEADGARFSTLYGHGRVELMQNIKFDRIPKAGDPAAKSAALDGLLPGDATPFVVLASVREQEEAEALKLLRGLLAARPDCLPGLFPRHLQRVDAWSELLSGAGIPHVLRSRAQEPVRPGTVLLWDRIGELEGAFAEASAAFVGGSLAPLGGQNFLEPLTHGLIPVIGPHWKNFAWVGEDILQAGLVRKTPDTAAALAELLSLLDAPPDRDAVRARFQAYVSERRGGTATACLHIAHSLKRR
ncbi:3-deoxy-D-manno-octulosonic acid transferase [Paucidesulfovibrio longus]|uniref:3-deoxy-D-manno-octulosonic acid transferase n=1 Tax=Paucidesulfovibrio longus TaxID=889 RepID=UPI0003B5BBDA|nr:glycosyltransferase N-terminal domain-containing protein [Paucidesulfovibrio longus]